MKSENEIPFTQVVFLPDGRVAPMILTAREVVSLLRLDGTNPLRTLKFYRDEGLLVGVRIGKKVRYPLSEIMKFIDRKLERNNSVTRCKN